VSDPAPVQRTKRDVVEMMPRSVDVPDSTIAQGPGDAEPAVREPVAGESAAPQSSIATDPPDAYMAADPALNGVFDRDLLEPV
jgi:hypothetical protein